MRLSPERMYDRMLASDPSYNGHFFTGVLTTGIYCLPSCRARKPKRQNVRFFPSCAAARAAGLRPCRKCHPDDFERGADPVLETVEGVVGEIRANPAAFADVRSVVRRSGFGPTRLIELFRLHYHANPGEVLLRARLERARRELLGTDAGLLEVASGAGFESLSVFHEHFRRTTGLTPAAYRELRMGRRFTLALPAGYPLPYLRRALSRDPHSISERLAGDRYTTAVRLSIGPALLTMELSADSVAVEISADVGAVPALRSSAGSIVGGVPSPRCSAGSNVGGVPSPRALPVGAEAHAIAVGLLGLDQDAAAFARLARKLGLARLVAGRPELRVSQTPSVYDGLLWSIIGQQINFPFACLLKRRLFERAGVAVAEGLVAPPEPADVARLTAEELAPLQFSGQKARYLIETSRLIAEGRLDLAALRSMSATRAERTLLAIRGLGPWSVNYLMMRALGFADCVPLGDTGVTSALQSLLRLEERPDIDATRRLMAVFSPYRSLATTHLWQFDKPAP